LGGEGEGEGEEEGMPSRWRLRWGPHMLINMWWHHLVGFVVSQESFNGGFS